MSFDTGLYIHKVAPGHIETAEHNLSSEYVDKIRTFDSAEAALQDIEERMRETCIPYEGVFISGFAQPEAVPRSTLGERLGNLRLVIGQVQTEPP